MPSITQLLIAGGIIRAILMLYSVYHDRTFRVKYTDIDYMIITDGAAEMAKGGTPFDRATFRYTPLLSLLMLPNVWWWLHCGKALFALCDVGAAWFCYRTLLTFATEKSAKIAVSVFILFNPIVVQVSTRGNSDMVVAFLSLAALASYFQKRYVVSAMWLGFAIHFKLYPVIYVIPFVFGLIEERRRQQSSKKAKSSTFLGATLSSLPLMIACGVAAVVLFAVPTYLCYKAYGQQYLDEALLYHFHREDHRHNMSPYWLAMYLNQGRRALVASAAASGETASIPAAWLVDYSAGWIAFAPQAAVLLFVSYRLRFNVAHACCIQTVLFVAFNKVCTVQYFVWFLPFLSFLFCVPKAGTGGSSKRNTGRSPFVALLVVLLWATTIPLWMRAAYEVEFLGNNDFILLWGASCVFFLATVGLAGWLGRIAIEMQKDVSTRRTE